MTSALKRHLRGGAALVGSVLLLTACGGDGTPLSTFRNKSDQAERLSFSLWVLLALCAVVFVGVQGAVIYMARKFRVDGDYTDDELYPDEEWPEQVHGNDSLEKLWTAIPFVVMAAMGVVSVMWVMGWGISGLSEADARGTDPMIERVDVVGQQWWWEFQYHLTDSGMEAAGIEPGTAGPHIVTAGEMPLPRGEEIALNTTSRDVIHSFWIPALNGKRDAVPGRYNPWTIQAGELGRWPGECTEFCGLSHAFMEKWVVGLELGEWQAWALNQAAPAEAPAEGTPAAAGWEVFAQQCASCHVINGLTTVSPGETHLEIGVGGDRPADFGIYATDIEAGLAPARLIDRQTQVSGAAPNLTHFATRSTFAGGIFDLYEVPDDAYFPRTATLEDGTVVELERTLNRGALEAWILNAPEQKANAWDSPNGARGMRPFETLSAEEVDNLVAFLSSLD